jgi:hypothetical protein
MRAAVVSTLLVVCAGLPAPLPAQTSQGPPTYGTDYSAVTTIAGFEMRRFRDWQLTIDLSVPTPEVEVLLPLGYSLPNAVNTTVVVAFVFQERVELMTAIGGFSAGSYGPVDEVLVLVSAISPEGPNEFVILDNLRSTDAAVNMTNGILGDGSARKATRLDLELTTDLANNRLIFKGLVIAGPLHIGADAVIALDANMALTRARVTPVPFRYLDNSFTRPGRNKLVRAGSDLDQLNIPRTSIRFNRDTIRLRHGTLTVLEVVRGRIDRWQELKQKIQPELVAPHD